MIIDDQDTHGIAPGYHVNTVDAPRQVNAGSELERHLPSTVVQPERGYCTLRLDRRRFCLSTPPSVRDRRRLRSQAKAISLLGKRASGQATCGKNFPCAPE